MDCTGAPAAQSLLGDLGFHISVQKSKLSWGGGREGKSNDNFELPEKLQLLAHSGKGRYSV